MSKQTFNTEIENIASKTLGDSTSYAVYTDAVDSSLLNPMPRNAGFEAMGFTTEHLGADIWHGHEMTFLLNSGMPYAGTLKVVYDANTEFMVESKSFKLYLNTFDMCKMGDTIEEAITNVISRVSDDTTAIVGDRVHVDFFPDNSETQVFDTAEYTDLQDIVSFETTQITDYLGKEHHLATVPMKGEHTNHYKTNILRSRCKVTKQRDIGSVFVKVKTSECVLDAASLLKQIVSLREQDEFHEFCASKLYHELMNTPGVTGCCVTMLYSRRGSLDICPTRASSADLLPQVLIDESVLTRKTQGQ